MRGVAFFVISICGSLISVSCATARLSSNKQRYEVEQHLKKLNKPAVKTILSPDGDIIDCVHISKQPAFDHPLLKDHKIKMRPSYHPAEGQFDANKESTRVNANKEATNDTKTIVSQLWHNNGKCPLGTIPIRRTKEEDVLRAGSMVNMYGMKKPGSFPIKPEDDSNDGSKGARYEHAIAYVGDAKSDKYHGSKVTINVWEPYVEPNEFSSSQMWILGGSLEGRLESIEAGWHVHPELYGDNNPRLFTYWTMDTYKTTGCYNLLCSGFIQINNEIVVGAIISPFSTYDYKPQYDISVLIWKDPKQGDWWLQYGNEYIIGYWPSSLFSFLDKDASMIQWGGEVMNSQSGGRHTPTQMGSGHFPEEGFGKTSYFKNIQVVSGSNILDAPKDLSTFTENSSCYDVRAYTNKGWGYHLYYGGLGKSDICP